MKKNKILGFGISLVALVLLATSVLAKTGERQKRSFSLPDNAKKVSEDTYYLGKAKDKDGREVEGYAYVYRRKDGEAKPDGVGGGRNKPGKGSTCYTYLSKGAKWKGAPENWVVNPKNTRGLSDTFVSKNLGDNVSKWESAAGQSVLGTGTLVDDLLEADTVSPDGANEVYFADIDSPGAIGVTIVWGIFGGPPGGRKLVEWDQIYDDVDFDWSASGESGKMDFGNIAIHELGHSMGLGDLYDSACSEATMYGYATEGETKKNTLEPGDIQGVSSLYK